MNSPINSAFKTISGLSSEHTSDDEFRISNVNDQLENVNINDSSSAIEGDISVKNVSDAMEIDAPHYADNSKKAKDNLSDIGSYFSESIDDTFVSNIKRKISTAEKQYDLCYSEVESLMLNLEFTKDKAVLDERNLKVEFLQNKITFLKNSIQLNNELLVSYERKIKIQLELNKKLTKNGSVAKANPIREKDLPVFNVKPSNMIRNLNSNHINDPNKDFMADIDDHSLKSFIRKFERVFKNYNVDIKVHWFEYLESCFEKKTSAFNWFVEHIKNPVENNKKKLSWNQAKDLLASRFDIASKNNIIHSNKLLLKIKQNLGEPLLDYVDRFQYFMSAANIKNTDDSLFFVTFFLTSLHGKDFQDKVESVLKEHYLRNKVKVGSSGASKFADHDFVPSKFCELEAILNSNILELERFLDDKSKKEVKSISSVSSSNSFKKRKFDETKNKNVSASSPSNSNSMDYATLVDTSRPLSAGSRQYLMKNGYCTFCRVNKYSVEHAKVCDKRKTLLQNKKVTNSKAPNSYSSNNVRKDDKNINSNVYFSRVNNSVTTQEKEDDSISDSDSNNSDDEYAKALAEYDQSLADGDHSAITINKNVFCIEKYVNCNDKFIYTSSSSKRKNTVGDINNTFETDNVAYAPVSCITINNIDCHCLIDTGAEVSILSKDFALQKNIQFKEIEGYLTLADGKRIPRLQTTEFLAIDYDGIEKTIPHKFDIIDNEQLFKEKKIIIGVDLLPKLNIYLSNVAYKFKTTTKIDDSIEDKAYEPNVTPYGSDREQTAFFKALETHIEANKSLDKNSLCNLPESILYLPTPDGYYVNVKQYPIAYSDQPKVMEIIDEWLDSGIITEAEPSEWNLPITVVPKKDLDGKKTDKIRVVLDTRLLNKALPTINETLPLIADIYHAMAGSKVFSTIDLKSAFSQFPVNAPDRKKTSFTAPNGLKYMHVGSPFGISTISQLFSRVMLTLFKNMPFVRCFVDDIVIFSQSIEAHFLHVKQVLQILTEVNLRVNFEKSHFAKAEVFLLGFSISEHGRRIDHRKLTNIQDWPRPISPKQCAGFLGFVNYFRMHLPNVAKLMAKLDTLRSFDALSKKSKKAFTWTEVHEKDFNALKDILASDITLSHPNYNHPFCIATDASNFAIGCCLYQEYKETTADGIEKTITKYIGFFSRKLSRSEQNYSTTMRELLAVIYALKQFHKYIWNVKFTVFCDHKAISYAHNQKNANSMMIKWLDVFLDYDFKVVYRKGLDNILPDLLSRLFEPDTVDVSEGKNIIKRIISPRRNHAISKTVNEKKKMLIKNLDKETVADFDRNDVSQKKQIESNKDSSNKIIATVSKDANESYCSDSISTVTDKINSSGNSIAMKNLFYVQSAQTIYADYMIPVDTEHEPLLRDAHNKVGHYGAEQMVKRLHLEGIHWPNLIQDCIQYIRRCTECQKHNIAKKGYHPARNLYSYVPGDHYAIDLGGPISTTPNSHYNYFLVVICVCTRFCILRPLTDKKSDTVLRALIDLFCLLGVPSVLSSDNGGEFSNTLSSDLSKSLGYDHRKITPLHASANGVSERLVQQVKRGLAKATQGVGNDWSLHLNAVQLSLNNRISKRLNSTPFSLMFARKMIEPYGFKSDNENSSTKPESRKPMSHEELMKRIDYMTDIVFPAINAKTKSQVELEEAKFNNKHRLVEYKPGDHVMVRVQTKLGQLAPAYEGPYTIVRKNQGNAYILRDHTGVLMPRNYTSVELKLISHDEVIELDDEGNEIQHFEVEVILDHRGNIRDLEYLVRWKNYSPEYDEWVPASHMNATELLRNYWKKLGIPNPSKKKGKNPPTSSELLKKNPPGSMSKFIESIDSEDDEIDSYEAKVLHKSNKRQNASSDNHNSSSKRVKIANSRSKPNTRPKRK
jgi:ribosomal protein L21E